MNSCNTNTIVVIISVVVVLVSLYVIYERYEMYEGFKIKTLYSEPSLTCELGGDQCVLSTGKYGICDKHSDRCIQVPNSMYYNLAPTPYNLEPPIGEISSDCQWRTTCERSDGNMGQCFSSECYPMGGYDFRSY